MITELLPEPGPHGHIHGLSPSSYHSIAIIVTSASATVVSTLAVTNPVLSNKPYVPTSPTVSGSHSDKDKYERSHKR